MIIDYLIKMHTVERVKRNRNDEAPEFIEMYYRIKNFDTGWYVLPCYMNIFHDNKTDLPEIKFVNLDGREYIYTADETGAYHLETEKKYAGSYNYVAPVVDKRNSLLVKFFKYPIKLCGHLIFDILPYLLLGD